MWDRVLDLVDKVRQDINPRRAVEIGLYTLFGLLGLILVYVLYRNDLLPYFIALSLVGLGGYGVYVWRRKKVSKTLITPHAIDGEQDDASTAEFEIVDDDVVESDQDTFSDSEAGHGRTQYGPWSPKQPRGKRHDVHEDENGKTYYVSRDIEIRHQERRISSRKLYREVFNFAEIDQNSLVDIKMCRKIDYSLDESERKIRAFYRLSWWEHGPLQIVYASVAILFTILMLAVKLRFDVGHGVVMFGAWVFVVLVLAAAYFNEWMKWAYHVVIGTDKSFGEIYRPPFYFKGYKRFVPISAIQPSDAEDQSWFANFLGKRRPEWLYGKPGFDTPSDKDEWLKRLKFVREHVHLTDMVRKQILRSAYSESTAQQLSRELADEHHRMQIEEIKKRRNPTAHDASNK